MNILVLAPHPFYQDRGSPIALNQMLKVLSERGDQIDVVVYHEGEEVYYDNVIIYRINGIPFMRHIRPGFSWKKVVCDLAMFFRTIPLVLRKHYDVIHAVEESVFTALVLKCLFRIPYIYDMDSSLPQQMLARYPFLKPCLGLFNFFEKLAVQHAIAIVPVCSALADSINCHNPKKVVVLQDMSLLKRD